MRISDRKKHGSCEMFECLKSQTTRSSVRQNFQILYLTGRNTKYLTTNPIAQRIVTLTLKSENHVLYS